MAGDRGVAAIGSEVGLMSSESTTQTAELAAETQRFRSQVGHISRQSGIYFAGTIFTAGFGYIFKVYLARFLGAEALGLYALGVTLTGMLGIFNTLGLPGSAMRFVAEYQVAGRFGELHALLWRGAALLVGANILFGAGFLVFGRGMALHFYHAPELVRYLPWFALIMMVGVVNSFYGKVLAGYRDLKLRTLIVNFVGSPLNMILAIVLITLGWGLSGYLVAQILSATVVGGLLLLTVRRFTPPGARFSAQPGAYPRKEVWSFSGAMMGIGLLEFLMAQVDKVALGYYRDAREVGIYSVAAAVVVYVPLILSSVNQIFAPTIADLHTRGERALLARLFQSLTKWVVGLTLPLATVVVIFARPLMRIFGPEFERGWPILIIGTIGQLINCGVGSVGYLLLMSGHEKRLIKVQMVMAAVMVVGSVALVPMWGIIGAAVAAAITNIGMNAWNLIEVRRALALSPYNRSYFRLIPGTVVMALGALAVARYSRLLRHDWLAVGAALGVAYVAFTATTLAVGLEADDRLIATAIWSRIRGAFGMTEQRIA
jgi:O-antigen/teichoic acid export membrane protein